jgi:hypothetical protein
MKNYPREMEVEQLKLEGFEPIRFGGTSNDVYYCKEVDGKTWIFKKRDDGIYQLHGETT